MEEMVCQLLELVMGVYAAFGFFLAVVDLQEYGTSGLEFGEVLLQGVGEAYGVKRVEHVEEVGEAGFIGLEAAHQVPGWWRELGFLTEVLDGGDFGMCFLDAVFSKGLLACLYGLEYLVG